MSKTMNSIFSAREYRGKNRRLGSLLATALLLYLGAVIAFIVAY
jgi:hypothetical protein